MTTAIAISGYTAPQLRTIKTTVAADTNQQEFDLFMEAARSYGLDPFRKQIHAVVYNKTSADKRKMSIIVSRDGLRVIAQRCKDYRPASDPAQIITDEALKGPTNPKGIVSATVKLWKQDNRGEWFPVIGEAYWDEFAPVKDRWEDGPDGKRRPTGGKELDASGQWAKMPIVMITKCAESQALRAGWPDQFGNIYSEEEMDRLSANLSATEAIESLEKEERMAKIGGPGIMMIFDETMMLEHVPLGMVADRCMEFIEGADPIQVHAWRIRNTASLQEFWAHEKSAALEIRKACEAKEALLGKTEAA